MADVGLLFACFGCCCGHPDKGGARIGRPSLRRAFEAAQLEGRVRLAFTECLGPCSEANVLFLFLHGRPYWFRRMNSPELFGALLGFVRAAVSAPSTPVPPDLLAHSFTWTGGGIGPDP